MILANSSLASAKLRRHLETKHGRYADKDINFFQRKHDELKKCRQHMVKVSKIDNEKYLEASYNVSYRIAQNDEAHTIVETLIKPCLSDVVKIVLGDDNAKKIASVPLSNSTVEHCIGEIASSIEEEFVRCLKVCDMFSLQMDESTNVVGLAILLVFIRYTYNKSIEENLLLCESLQANTSGEKSSSVLIIILRSMIYHGQNV